MSGADLAFGLASSVGPVPFSAVDEARLVLTDGLIRAALKQDKKARQERKTQRKASKAGKDDAALDDAGAEQEDDF